MGYMARGVTSEAQTLGAFGCPQLLLVARSAACECTVNKYSLFFAGALFVSASCCNSCKFASLRSRAPCRSYRQFRGLQTKRTWSNILTGVVDQPARGSKNDQNDSLDFKNVDLTPKKTLSTGCVCSKHAYRGTSWTALTLEVGKSPTATPRRAELPVA